MYYFSVKYYRDMVFVVLGLEDVQSGQLFLGVIHIHPIAVKESGLIKIAVTLKYKIRDAHGRHPVHLLSKRCTGVLRGGRAFQGCLPLYFTIWIPAPVFGQFS